MLEAQPLLPEPEPEPEPVRLIVSEQHRRIFADLKIRNQSGPRKRREVKKDKCDMGEVKLYYLNYVKEMRSAKGKRKSPRCSIFSSQTYSESNIKISHPARESRSSCAIGLKEKLNKSARKTFTKGTGEVERN